MEHVGNILDILRFRKPHDHAVHVTRIMAGKLTDVSIGVTDLNIDAMVSACAQNQCCCPITRPLAPAFLAQ